MTVSFTITRTTTRFHDSNGNGVKDAGELDFDLGEVGVYDPGDILYTRIKITNTGDQPATGVTVADNFSGSTFVDAGNVVSGTPFINISPIASNDTFQAIGNTVLRVGTANTMNGGESTFFAGNLLSNDVGSLAGDSIQGFQIDVVGDGTFAGSGVTAKGGHYNIFADGTFNYVNSGTDASLTDGDSFTYTIRDKGFDGVYNTADDLVSTATATITFAEQSPGTAHRVWYVDSAAAPGGDGTSASPFQTLAAINGAGNNGAVTGDLDQAGEYIYVENGAGAAVAGPITLENGQQLIGDGAALVVAGSTLAAAGTNSTITAATGSIVTLGSGNTIAGLNLGAGTGTATAITGTNFGTLTVNEVAINSGGAALNLNTGTFAGTGFTSTDSDGGTTNVSLVNVTGNVALGSGALAGATTNAINIANTTGAPVTTGLTYSGSVTHAGTGALLNVDGGAQGHLGTIDLTGAKTATAGNGLNFENADGTYTFSGATSLSGGNAGIDIVSNTAANATQGSAGSFTFGGTFTINNPGGSALVVSDSTASINFDVDVTQSSNFAAVDVTNHSGGTFTFQTTASINATNGTGLQFTNADGTYTMNSANTLNGGDAGIDIDGGSDGSFSFISNTSITNPTGDAFVVDGSGATVSFGGSITDNSGRVVNINGHDLANNITFTTTSSITATAGSTGILIQESNTGGTIAFNGQVQLTTGANTAVTLTNNSGKTINFNADDLGFDISTTSGSGFVANNGGTITVSDVGSGNTINVSAGSGATVGFSATGGTTIGAGGVIFDTISQSGGTSGIVLNTTGAGSFFVLGTGGANSGGTITGVTGPGINLTSTGAVSLTRMLVQNGGDDGIRGSTVNGFTLSNSTVLNNGNADEEHGVDLSNVTGSLLVDTSTVRGSFEHNFKLDNQVGTLNTLNIKNSTFDHLAIPGGAAGGNGVLVVTGGTAVITDASISNSVFRNNFSNGILVNAEGASRIGADNATAASTDGFVVSGSTFDDNNIAIQFGQFNTADLTVDIQNNTIINDNRTANVAVGGTSMAIVVGSSAIAGAGSSLNARIDGNTIGNAAINGSGSSIGSGIRVIVQGLTDATVVINNNTIFETPNGYGIEATFLGPQDNLGVVPTSDITVTNNNVDHTNIGFKPGSSDFPLPAIFIAGDNQGGAPGAPTVRADVRGNTVPTALPPVGFVSGFTNNWLEVYEYDAASGTGNISLLDTGAADANATAQLQNNNTGRSGANVPNVALFTGSITTAPDLSPLPINAEAPPPPPPPVIDEPGDTPPVVVSPPPPPPPPVPGSTPVVPIVVDDGVLSQAEIDFLVDAAIERWIAAGATDEQVAAMRAVTVSVADMGGLLLGESGAGTIKLDSDAAGWRWFVDSTPGDDSEYAGTGTKLTAVNPNGTAGTRIDLLTVITHELGHQIGLSDLSNPGSSDELMFGTIGAGQRRLPGSDDLDHAAPGPVSGAFAFAPVTLGTIPAGQTVIVEFRHVIDNPGEDRLVGNWRGQTTLTSNEIAAQQSALEAGNIDGLTLGNLVFKDVNKNGVYDVGTDTALAGVTLTLYGDTNNNGVYDEGVDLYVGYTEVNGTPGYQQGADTPADPGTGIALTVTTNASGLYSFGSLAPGDYIVRVNASNFDPGGALVNLLVTPGTAGDPDDDVDDNDNNGVAGAGGIVVSKAIRLDYDSEPTAGLGNDTNNTVDFGFVQNDPPVAADDPGLTATEDTPAEYSTELTANDTDPDVGDTLTVTAAGNATNGSVSVTAGVVTFTPTANFNGIATFEYTVSDGKGNSDVGLATVTVGAVNDPVTIAAPASAGLNEDSVDFAVTGISIADVDAALAPAGVYEVVLAASQGSLKLTTTTGLTFTVGDGSGNATMTFHGTLADINAALATAKYTPAANYNGAAQIDIDVTDEYGATVATGSGAATADFESIDLTVNSVNDAPLGANQSSGALEGVEYVFTAADFSENFSDPVDGNGFAGIRITSVPATGTLELNGVAVTVPADVTLAQLINGDLTYTPAAGSANTSPTFQFRVRDDGGTANGGQDLAIGENLYTINIAPANAAPVLDLDADGAGTGFASSYTEGGAAAAIGDTDVSITDTDSGDDIVSATITITNPEAGDILNVGTLPATVTVDLGNSSATSVKLTAAPGTSRADFEAAIEAITFSNTGDDPTDKGTNLSRSVSVVVNDGTADSNVATATIAVTDVNDAPTGTNATITVTEDTFRFFTAADFGFVDADGTLGSVTFNSILGGTLYYDADGPGGNPATVTNPPFTVTAAELAAGAVSLYIHDDNGPGTASISFTVADNDGASAVTANVLTVDVTPVNDSPVLTTGGPIAATEQTAVAILPAGSVYDVDLDELNGGAGDYAGASFSVNRDPATNAAQDRFSLVAGPNFTIDGSNLRSGGLIFATISVDGSAGVIVVTFTSAETKATSALVDEVIQAVRYTNISDNPPASVNLAVGFDDGSPGGGQGNGEADFDVNVVTVNIAAVNDAPVNSLGGTIGTGEDAIDAWLSGMSISDPDADPAADEIYVTFQVTSGLIEIRTDVAGGIVLGNIIAQANNTITVQATLNQINATLAASNGLTYTPNANFNGDVTLTVTTNDAGQNGTDPGLTGDANSEEDEDTRIISVEAQDDLAVAQNDALSTPEDMPKSGTLFSDNGSGADFDVESNPFFVTKITVGATDYAPGTVIDLPSGAKLTVNADGTYTYDPNEAFNTLTAPGSGAVNISAEDIFTYTVTGGDTATVTMTVQGVVSGDDLLMGDSGDNIINGTPGPDRFRLQQGGNDTARGFAGTDSFYFGGALTGDDKVDGGDDRDQISLQGDYSSQLTLGAEVINVEFLLLVSGNDTRFGDTGTNSYSYNIVSRDENVVALEPFDPADPDKGKFTVDGGQLQSGENLTFDGSAELDGAFRFFGGLGDEDLTGGAQSDQFTFNIGRWGSGDKVDGGGSRDQLALRGDYNITFGAGQITSIESILLLSGQDVKEKTDYDYTLVMNDGNLAAGVQMTIDAGQLKDTEHLTFDGSAEEDGRFRIFGGAGVDVITGGDQADILVGRLGPDTLTGGAGNDQFRYDSPEESPEGGDRDGIQDFTLGDVIDLSRIDANSQVAGLQAFDFIESDAFTGAGGELRFENFAGNIWLVQADVDGDKMADLELFVVVTDGNPITATDFFL